MRHKSKNVLTTSAWHSVILESDLARIDRETTLTANTLSNKKGTLQKIWDPHKKRRGSSSARTTILLHVVFERSTHVKSQKNSKGWKVTYLHSSSDSESDDPERQTIARGQVKTLAHKLQQIPNKYPVDTAKMNLPPPDTTSEYLFSLIFKHSGWKTDEYSEKKNSTNFSIQIFSSDSENSKWTTCDMWQGEMSTWSTSDWFTNQINQK